jgi:endonuclease/exonuclease/phosphatase family metal-dependent hydrolase
MANATEPRHARLRIASFNLENLGGREDSALAGRIERLRPQLLRLDADVLCLQEVNAQEPAHHPRIFAALDHVLENTPYAGFFRAASTGPGGREPADRHNLVTLSKYPIRASRQIRNELVPPLAYRPTTAIPEQKSAIESRFERPILHAEIDLPGNRRLHVLNLHLKATLATAIPGQKESAFVWKSVAGWAEGFFIASLKRAGQALEARLYVDRLFDADPEALIAVCGDFNASGHEVPVRVLLGETDDTGNGRLLPRALIPLERNLPAARRFSVLHAGRPVMLDHILVSRALGSWFRDIEADNAKLHDEVFDAGDLEVPLESFHAPVVAEFALAG